MTVDSEERWDCRSPTTLLSSLSESASRLPYFLTRAERTTSLETPRVHYVTYSKKKKTCPNRKYSHRNTFKVQTSQLQLSDFIWHNARCKKRSPIKISRTSHRSQNSYLVIPASLQNRHLPWYKPVLANISPKKVPRSLRQQQIQIITRRELAHEISSRKYIFWFVLLIDWLIKN